MADPLAHIDAWGSPKPPPSNLDPSSSQSPAQYSNTSYPSQASPHSQTQPQNHYDPSPTDFRREPKIFGLPDPPLLSPQAQSQSSAPLNGGGSGMASSGPFLRVRLIGMERNRKDVLIRFDASTNLTSFRTTLYRNIQRSYIDFQLFAEQLSYGNPQTVVPALPLSQTSAVTDEEDDRLVKLALQRWFARVCEDPVLQRDDELRNFVESDFGYQPAIPRAQTRSRLTPSTSTAASAFSSITKVFPFRKGPPDEDADLQAAKGELGKLEERWAGVAQGVVGVGKARKAFASAEADTGAKLISLATAERNQDLALALRKVGRAMESLAGMSQGQVISDNVVLSDTLGYQSLNAKAAKETLIQRTHILEEAQTASKAAINKRRVVERMKGSSNINPSKVDDALEDMREASELDQHLAQRVQAISTNLRTALQGHSARAHEDVAEALLEHARGKIMVQRQKMKELEGVMPEIARIGRGVAPTLKASVSTGRMGSSSGVPQVQSLGQGQSQGYGYTPGPPLGGQGSYAGNFGSTSAASPPQPRAQPNLSQSLYIPPTQPHSQPPSHQSQSAYPHQSQPNPQSYQQPFQSPYASQSHTQSPPGITPLSDPLASPTPTSISPSVPAPYQGVYSGMSQSLFLPGGSKAPVGYGGKRLDDRAAAKTLANMF